MTGTVGNLSWKADTERPNIVLMLADNIGFGDLGCGDALAECRLHPSKDLETGIDRVDRDQRRFAA